MSEESKKKLSKARIGMHFSKEHIANMSKVRFGKKLSEEHRKAISEGLKKNPPMLGKHHTPEARKKISDNLKASTGENARRWRGGPPKCKSCGKPDYHYTNKSGYCRACSPFNKGKNHYRWVGEALRYGREFNDVLKDLIRARDDFRCQECGCIQGEEKLSIHHIDYNPKNNDPDNLISLCRRCHLYTGYNRENWTNHFIRRNE